MLSGYPPQAWEWSVVLRRVLFPLLALPFMRILGFLTGGFVTSVLINVGALLGFSYFVKRRFGTRAGIATAWLVATYPGITYWAGLPYSYTMIVPCSLVAGILLTRLNEAQDLVGVVSASLLLGLMFCGYDLLPFFLPPALIILAWRRRLAWMAIAGVAAVAPPMAVNSWLERMGVPAVNSNTSTYGAIISSYLHPAASGKWLGYLSALPSLSVTTFLFSNLVFVPLLFLALTVWSLPRRRPVITVVEGSVLVTTLLIFLFNNAAPPYYGWQMRGDWVARLYQPVVVAYLLCIARAIEQASDVGTHTRVLTWTIVLVCVAGTAVILSPMIGSRFGAYVYHRFYAHSSPEWMLVNRERYGARPLGVCRETHEFDGMRDPMTPLTRPSFMYRYPGRD
jgi:hypothetical protein